MKKIISLFIVVLACFCICACNNEANNTSASSTTTVDTTAAKEEPKTPTVAEIVNGIKYDFKDPDSVRLSDAHIARVKKDGVESKTEFYVIGTIHAKNSFGGYGNPQAYIIHCNNGKYKIVDEYNDESYMMQRTFNALGCGASWSID